MAERKADADLVLGQMVPETVFKGYQYYNTIDGSAFVLRRQVSLERGK